MNNALICLPDCAAIAVANPLAGMDHQIAAWFHAHLTPAFAAVLGALSQPGSEVWVGAALGFATLFLMWRKRWSALVTLVLAVPGGMLLNELLKVAVQRQRPFLEGPFVDWSGYSFASGHTMGATLLYGQLAIVVLPAIKGTRARVAAVVVAVSLVLLVGFSRIALGAHYLTDVLAAMVLGVLWLALCMMASRAIRRKHSKNTFTAETLQPGTETLSTLR